MITNKPQEFKYYNVEWLELDFTGFYYIKKKRFYFKDEALDYKELVDKSKMTKNCTVCEVTETHKFIA